MSSVYGSVVDKPYLKCSILEMPGTAHGLRPDDNFQKTSS